jgi:hypothetical protein
MFQVKQEAALQNLVESNAIAKNPLSPIINMSHRVTTDGYSSYGEFAKELYTDSEVILVDTIHVSSKLQELLERTQDRSF